MDLAALCAAAVGGAASGGWIAWGLTRRWPTAAAAFVAGGILAALAVRPLASALYRSGDRISVVKVGPGSLPRTIRAGLWGGVASGLLIAALGVVASGGRWAATLLPDGAGLGAAAGLLIACLGSLL